MRYLALLSLLGACTATIEPNGAGVVEGTADGPDGLELPVTVWFPADTTDASTTLEYQLGVSGAAYLDAEPATGPFPVIVSSHGNGGGQHAGALIYEEWAAAGYVVVAMDHVGNTFTDTPTNNEWVEIFIRRPEDVAAAYRAAVSWSEDEDHVLSGLIDPEQLIIAGHSTGGATAVLASGGALSKTTVTLACSAGQLSGTACELAAASEGDISLMPADLPDPVATLAMAPLNGGLFATDLDMTGSSLVMVGTEDSITPSDSHATPIYEAMPSTKALVELEGGNHYGFATICTVPGLSAVLPSVASQCDDPDYLSEEAFVAATVDISLAFFDHEVRGNADASAEAAAAAHPVSFVSE